MPEGPEVRRHAVALDQALANRSLTQVAARTKAAKQWLLGHSDELLGRRVLQVRAHGKNLYGIIEGNYFFYSHLMMWGRWQVMPTDELGDPDRRERARLVNAENACVLMSAPVFEIGAGQPYDANEYLRSLGPDILPYEGAFDEKEVLRRLLLPENRGREIGAALLDQRIAAGIGNYLRAEILFHCRLNPFRITQTLNKNELNCLIATIPAVAKMAYQERGATIGDEWRARLLVEDHLVYPGTRFRETAARHAVFRRTNLPCLECGAAIRQLRQVTYVAGDDEDGSLDKAREKTRIIYFCPQCQNVELEAKKPRCQQNKVTP